METFPGSDPAVLNLPHGEEQKSKLKIQTCFKSKSYVKLLWTAWGEEVTVLCKTGETRQTKLKECFVSVFPFRFCLNSVGVQDLQCQTVHQQLH